MGYIRNMFTRKGGWGGHIGTTDVDRVAINALTDGDWTETIGRKGDTAFSGAVGAAGNQSSLMAILKGVYNQGGVDLVLHHPNYALNAITMAAGTTGAIADHEILKVTGLVRIQLLVSCPTLLESGGAATISLGLAGDTDYLIADTVYSLIDADEIWASAVDGEIAKFMMTGNAFFDFISDGIDVGYEIKAATLTAGVLNFISCWQSYETGAKVEVEDGTAVL